MIKYKRVICLVLALKLYVIITGFNIKAIIQTIINSILLTKTSLTKILLVVCTDSYLLYDYIIKLESTAEKRLIIDIIGLRQSYKQKKINKVR